MKREIYAIVLLVVFLSSTVVFGIVMESGHEEIEIPESLKYMNFDNMGRKTLESTCQDYNVTMDELIVELGLPNDINPLTKLKDLPLEGDTGDIVKAAIIKMKLDSVVSNT